MPTFLLNPTTILGILLALSLMGNGVLYKIHTHDLEKIGGLKQAMQDARADAEACSAGVKALRAAAESRDRATAKALQAAEARARKADEQADKTLQARPTSEDVCASALELNREKLKERHP